MTLSIWMTTIFICWSTLGFFAWNHLLANHPDGPYSDLMRAELGTSSFGEAAAFWMIKLLFMLVWPIYVALMLIFFIKGHLIALSRPPHSHEPLRQRIK